MPSLVLVLTVIGCSTHTSADFYLSVIISLDNFLKEDKHTKNERRDPCHLEILPRRACVIVKCSRISIAHAPLNQVPALLPVISSSGTSLSLRRHLHRTFSL